MSKHTPGPWKHVGESGDGKYQIVESDMDRDNWECCSVRVDSDDCDYDMAVANARLIAAAPDMYEALQEIAKGEGRYSRDQLTHASNTVEAMKALAVAAIAKAQGAQPEGGAK